jgi:hypothetical protein
MPCVVDAKSAKDQDSCLTQPGPDVSLHQSLLAAVLAEEQEMVTSAVNAHPDNFNP